MAQESNANKSTIGFDKELAEVLCDLEVSRNVKLSPNGDRVVYEAGKMSIKGKNYVSALWIASASEPGSARQLTSGQFLDKNPVWHPDGQHIAFLSDRWKGNGGISKIWMIGLGGGDAFPLSPTTSEQAITKFAFSPDGETIAFLARDEKLKEDTKSEETGPDKVNVWGQQWQYSRLQLLTLKTKQAQTLVAGSRHISNFLWSPDGKGLLFQSTATTDGQSCYIDGTTVSTFNVESRQVKDLCTVQTSVSDLAWGADNRVYILMADMKISRLSCDVVYAVDAAESNPKLVKAACGESDTAGRLLLADGNVLVERHIRHNTVITEMGGEDLFSTDVKVSSWDVFYGGKTEQPTFAAVMSNTNQPGEVFIVKDGQVKTKLSNHGQILEERLFGSLQVLTCQSLDGEVELDGLYLTPACTTMSDDAPKKPIPTIVLIHGGPLDRNVDAFDPFGFLWTPYLLSRGYGILFPQYRGSTGRGEKFASYSKNGMGKYAYEDVIAVTDNAVKKGFADGKRIMVGGWSGGGMLSFLSAVRNGLHGLGWRFNAAISGAGICDMQTVSLTSDIGLTLLVELGGGYAAFASSGNTSARESSAIWEVASAIEESRRREEPVIPPVLMLHGELDSRCPVSQSKAFHHVLKTSGLPCELVTYPGQGHTPARYAHWMDMLERVGRWCDEYIGFQ